MVASASTVLAYRVAERRFTIGAILITIAIIAALRVGTNEFVASLNRRPPATTHFLMTRTPRQIKDEQLALRCRLGEPAAFAELVETMEAPLMYSCGRSSMTMRPPLTCFKTVWMTAFRGLAVWMTRRRCDRGSIGLRGHAVDHVRRDTARASAERGLADENTEIASSEAEPRFDTRTPRFCIASWQRSTFGTERYLSCTFWKTCR